MQDVKITVNVARILACFLEQPQEHRYGYDLMQQAQVSSGTLYPILDRLEHAGWLDAAWESVDPADQGRPARRYFRLTPGGLARAQAGLARLQQQLTGPLAHLRRPWPGITGGTP